MLCVGEPVGLQETMTSIPLYLFATCMTAEVRYATFLPKASRIWILLFKKNAFKFLIASFAVSCWVCKPECTKFSRHAGATSLIITYSAYQKSETKKCYLVHLVEHLAHLIFCFPTPLTYCRVDIYAVVQWYINSIISISFKLLQIRCWIHFLTIVFCLHSSDMSKHNMYTCITSCTSTDCRTQGRRIHWTGNSISTVSFQSCSARYDGSISKGQILFASKDW